MGRRVRWKAVRDWSDPGGTDREDSVTQSNLDGLVNGEHLPQRTA